MSECAGNADPGAGPSFCWVGSLACGDESSSRDAVMPAQLQPTMDKEKVLQWLRGVEDKGDLFTRFSTYGDDDNGTVWFEYIGQHAWGHSCYDTRKFALDGQIASLEHMTNYLTLLIAAQLQGNTPA